MELAIDTSTEIASVAVSQEGELVAEMTWHSGQNHTVGLVPGIISLLAQINADIQSTYGISVAKGPGSFNGLRVGVSTAKGLAFALDIPIVGISTLEVEAYQFAYTELPICAIHNAGRGEIAVAVYQQKGDRWQQMTEEHLTTADTLCEQVKDKTLFCGDIPPPAVLQLQKQLGKQAVIPDPIVKLRHASYLAILGWHRLRTGDKDNPASLQPTYLRQPPITQPKTRKGK